ncbi:MAG: hypothetical protein O7C67_20970 [Gammaproteobacteria bacterium]|nr:hypothetical protein [Gammaproteobacteria bacterium]
MTTRLWLWLVPGLLYASFTFWYTNTAGPLSDDEIAMFVQQMERNGGSPQQIANMRRFMEEDTGRQFLMVNIIDMADTPRPVEGVSPDETSDQVMGRYMAHMYPELFKRASHPAFVGNAVFDSMDIVGIEGAEQWTRAALMRYRSRRDILEIALNPVFAGKHDFKMAALDKTIAYPVETQIYLSDPRFLLFLILLAGTALVDLLIFRRPSQ